MARVRIDLPDNFPFVTEIPVRITDINYGKHVGNDTVLSLIHEARMQFLHAHGYTELDFAGTGMIMSDVAIEFKNELIYGDLLKVSVAIAEISKVSFTLFYKLERIAAGQQQLAAIARTGMVCFNYDTKKIAAVPESVRKEFGV